MTPAELASRWTTKEGAERRSAVLADLVRGADWRRHLAGLPGSGTAAGFADLRGIDLAGASLPGADLSLTRLDGATLRDAILDGADLGASRLDLADGRGLKARVARAAAIRTYGGRFDTADLSEGDFYAANLACTRFRRASFRGARLARASIAFSDLVGADLRGAQLWRSDREGAAIGGADRDAKRLDPELAAFPSFADAAAEYQSIATSRAKLAGAVIDAGARKSPRPVDEALALLGAPDWRRTVVGAAVAVAVGPAPAIVAALWRELDAGSWVAPQCGVAAFLLDAEFEAACGRRLLGKQPSFRAGEKNVGALVALWRRLPGMSGEVSAAIDAGRLPAAPDGAAGDLAIRWLGWVNRSFDEPDVRARWISGRAS